jgi:hypothetical protein
MWRAAAPAFSALLGCNAIFGVDDLGGAHTEPASSVSGASTSGSAGGPSASGGGDGGASGGGGADAGGAGACTGDGSACDTCALSACAASFCACQASGGCTALLGCFEACPKDRPLCLIDCRLMTPTGHALQLLFFDCMLGCPGCPSAPLTACQRCAAEQCAAELDGCLGEKDWWAWTGCLLSCNPQPCSETCAASHPTGAALSGKLAACEKTACAGACAGAAP